MVQRIALKAGQGVVQTIIEGRTVLKVVEVPNHQMAGVPSQGPTKTAGLPSQMLPTTSSSPHTAPQSFVPPKSQDVGMQRFVKGLLKPATSTSTSSHLQQVGIPVRVKTFTPPTMQQQQQQLVKQQLVNMSQKSTGLGSTIHWTNQQLADLQASFPAHMVPKTSAPHGKPSPQTLRGPLSLVRTPVIVNSNGLQRTAPPSTNVPKIQPNQQPKPVSSTTVPTPDSAPSSSNPPIPSWAPGGSKPLIKQVKTSTGQLVWAQAVSSEQIPGSDKAVFKFKALGPVDPNNPNTPPPALKPELTQPRKEPTIQPKKTQGALHCPFENCSETFSTLQEMDIHGGMHGAAGKKASCPHCKIVYNR